jgi:hypothetical protein
MRHAESFDHAGVGHAAVLMATWFEKAARRGRELAHLAMDLAATTTRRQHTTVSWCTSRPAHRLCNVFIATSLTAQPA